MGKRHFESKTVCRLLKENKESVWDDATPVVAVQQGSNAVRCNPNHPRDVMVQWRSRRPTDLTVAGSIPAQDGVTWLFFSSLGA